LLWTCCYVCMFLYVLLNDCVTFFWVSWAAFDQNRLILYFCRPVLLLTLLLSFDLIRVFIIRCLSSHLQLSSANGLFLTMALLIVMDFWFSGDVFVIWFVYFIHFVLSCCRRHCAVAVYCCTSFTPLFCIQPWDCFLLFSRWTASVPFPLLLLRFNYCFL
jgi:hypothetical protein